MSVASEQAKQRVFFIAIFDREIDIDLYRHSPLGLYMEGMTLHKHMSVEWIYKINP